MVLVTVESEIVKDSDRLKPKGRVVLDADDGWFGLNQFFKKPIIIAVHIQRQDSDFREAGLDEIQVIQRQKRFNCLDARREYCASVSYLPGIAVYKQTLPIRVLGKSHAIEFYGMKPDLDKGTRNVMRQTGNNLTFIGLPVRVRQFPTVIKPAERSAASN